VKNAKIVQL